MPARAAAALLGLALLAGLPRDAGAGPADGNDVIGGLAVHVARHEDTIEGLARRYDLGFVEMMAANPGIDPWVPGEGRELLIPAAHILPDAPRRGIVVNLPEMRLYHFRGDGSIRTFPVGIGRDYWQTPEISTTVTAKRKDPVWHPPASIRAEKPELPARVEAGPDNPLGAFAMNLAYGSYVIHGTNKPSGVGRRVSHGCLRLYPEDIETLFSEVPTGTPVRIVNQEIKIGWSGGALYLEAHPSQDHADEIEAGRSPDYWVDLPGFMIRLADMPPAADADLDWPLIEQTLRERRGVPVRISRDRAEAGTPAPAHFLRDAL